MSRATNMFAVLDDSDDEDQNQKVVPSSTAKSSSQAKGDKSKKSGGGSGGGGGALSSDGRGKPRRNPNNDRNTKGGRGPRVARDGKRTYDRRSGTGRGREIKKGGGGARNWGSDKNDARRAAENGTENSDANANAEKGDEGEVNVDVDVAADTPNEGEEEVVVEEEEVDNTVTLEEFMSNKKEVSLFGGDNVKKSVENEFEGKSARVADLEENFLVMGTGKALRKKGSGKKEAEKLDIDFRFKRGGGDDRPRRGGGRDGRDGRGDRRGGDNRRSGGGGGRDGRDGRGDRRGGGRRDGGGNRGGNRGGRGRDPSFALDSNAFPSL